METETLPVAEGEIRPALSSGLPRVEGQTRTKLKRARCTRWNNDGPTEEVSSLSVLLDWLTTEGSYARWRGGDSHSWETNAALATQIATFITSRGVTTGRKGKDIVNKVGQLEQSVREAVDFLSNTGAGITDELSLKAAIEKRCVRGYTSVAYTPWVNVHQVCMTYINKISTWYKPNISTGSEKMTKKQ
ncbi:unnamed protein product [Phytophthora fragariaefolia]|uniref:Unnamed protein product n=1 Tax=Phytophthora fragariaefolia TaxID=1490495 RepID=A0A9W6XMH4_9STRA|nr:unnamed protein product [Phytophthora fragariaefolia]